MADLFTQLAQGRGDPEAVQPRLKARFEDGAYASAEAADEALPAADVGPAPAAEGPLAPQEAMDAAVADEQAPMPVDQASPSPRRTADATRPEHGDRASAVEPARPAAQQPRTTVSRTIIEKVGTVQPGDENPALPHAPQQRVEPREMPPVQPAPPPARAAEPESRPAPADHAPTIEVHIGRIEIRRAAPPAQQAPAARPRFEPPLSLSAYLARRNGGEE